MIAHLVSSIKLLSYQDGDDGGEGGDDGARDELYEKAEVANPRQYFYQAGPEGECDRLVRDGAGVVVGHEEVDSCRPHRGLPGGAQQTVDEAGHDAGVQPVLQGQPGQGGVADTLGDDSEGRGDPGYDVTHQHLQAVARYPGEEGKSLVHKPPAANLLTHFPQLNTDGEVPGFLFFFKTFHFIIFLMEKWRLSVGSLLRVTHASSVTVLQCVTIPQSVYIHVPAVCTYYSLPQLTEPGCLPPSSPTATTELIP